MLRPPPAYQTTAALITKSFDALKTDPKIGRAEALRPGHGGIGFRRRPYRSSLGLGAVHGRR
jgi:hypothetical protein